MGKGSGGRCGLRLDAIDFDAEDTLGAAAACCDELFNGGVAGARAEDVGDVGELRGVSALSMGCKLRKVLEGQETVTRLVGD